MKKVIVIDNNGEEVKVDLKNFVHHINVYHKTGISVHDESGHYFTVDDNFRRKLKEIVTEKINKMKHFSLQYIWKFDKNA